MSEIILERETANDESALIVAVFVLSGTAVEADQLLFETENSKATQEVRAQSAGILTHSLAVGQEVEFGVAIAQIGGPAVAGLVIDAHADALPPPKAPDAPKPAAKTLASVDWNGGNGRSSHGSTRLGSTGLTVAASPVIAGSPSRSDRSLSGPRLSRAAAALLAESGLAAADFDFDFVTSLDVRVRMGRNSAPGPAAAGQRSVKMPAQTAPVNTSGRSGPGADEGQSPAPRKRAEIDALSNGAGNSMLSVLGVTLGPLTIARASGHFLDGRITDLVIFEASRMMKKFPRLNSWFADGLVYSRDFVHAGLAIDSGERLVVYGIENADALGLPELGDTMADAVARYVDNELTAAEMMRATFTVTDLSGDELDFVLPLLPRGQTLILAITRGINHGAPAGFRLFAGFDHRVTEGREVAIFLGELRERLLSFSSGVAGLAAVAASAHCEYCGRSAAEAMGKSREKGLLKVVGLDGREVLCCGSCWNGW